MEEMSGLWQAIVGPIRLSSVIKVGVVFISPPAQPPAVAPKPTRANVAVGADLRPGMVPQLLSIATPVTFIVPASLPDQPHPPPEQVGVVPGPVVVTGGDTIVVGGSGLDQASAAEVYLGRLAGGPAWQVTNPWRRPPPAPDQISANEIVLILPSAYMAPGAPAPTPPTVMPPPGVYQLMVGGAAPLPATAIPIAIAARLSNVPDPPALVADSTGLYTVSGEGFTPGSTAVALGAFGLAPTGAANPAAGFFFIDASGGPNIRFGRYFLHTRVSGVERPPSWWVAVP